MSENRLTRTMRLARLRKNTHAVTLWHFMVIDTDMRSGLLHRGWIPSYPSRAEAARGRAVFKLPFRTTPIITTTIRWPKAKAKKGHP